MRTLSGCLIATAFLTGPLLAQEKIEASETSFHVRTAGGNLAVCGFDANFVYRDQTYKQGALAGISASLEWLEDKGNIGLLFKVTGWDFPNADKQNVTKQLFRIDHAFVVVDGKVVKPNNSNRCEEPSAFCGGYWLPASAAISVALRQGKLAVGFNRESNGLDINLPIDPTDGIRTKPNEYEAFADCIHSIVDRAKAKIQHQQH